MPKVATPAASHAFPSQQRAPSTPRRSTRYSPTTPGRSAPTAATPSRSSRTTAAASPASKKESSASVSVSAFLPPVPADEEHLWDVLYTDGACSNNGKGAAALAGIGVWSAADEGRRMSERCPGEQTNNRAELIALIRALESTPFGGKQLLLKTDSEYAIKCVYQWMPNWALNGWKTANGKDVKNQPLLRYLAALLQLRDMRGKVRLQHVRGHSGQPGNDAADALARAGALLPARADEDWEAKLQDVQDQIDGDLMALADVHSPRRAHGMGRASVWMSPRKSRAATGETSRMGAGSASPRKAKEKLDIVEEDDEFPDSAGEWMEDIDEAELAKLDSSPAKPSTSATASTSTTAAAASAAAAAASTSVAVAVDEFADADDPFADLTAEQLDELERARPNA